MKLYWSLNSIPELANLPKERRKEIWKPCRLKCLASWPFWVSMIAIIVVWLVMLSKLGYFYSDNHIIGLIWGVIVSVIVSFIMQQVEFALVRPYIREYLISHEKTN
jgi:Mn2+/Fe2+ NRAMP family transporter